MTVIPETDDAPGHALPSLGDVLLDEYVTFVSARCRPNTVLAVFFDLRVFFRVVGKPVPAVSTGDVLAFIVEQRNPRRGNVVRIADGESGMAASTIKRRLASVSGLFAYLVARGVVAVNPVPRGLAARRPGARGVPLIRAPRRLPRVLDPGEVTALLAALRTHRDRALVLVMVLGGLRRVEALGLALGDLQPGDRRVRVTHAKGGRERIVPVDDAFFAAMRDFIRESME